MLVKLGAVFVLVEFIQSSNRGLRCLGACCLEKAVETQRPWKNLPVSTIYENFFEKNVCYSFLSNADSPIQQKDVFGKAVCFVREPR